jgi:hypothetical protein
MMMEFSKEELKGLVLDSYALLLDLPAPENRNNKYEMKSRSKLKNLPEALREMDDPSAAITHFVKNASYFLPRAERGKGTERGFDKILSRLLERVNEYVKQERAAPERARRKIQYLIGYLNWGADSICALMTATDPDVKEFERRLHTMLTAELAIVGGETDVDGLQKRIMAWVMPPEASSHTARRA